MGRRTRTKTRRRRIRFRHESIFYDVIDLFLTHWPEFQYSLYLFRGLVTSQLKSDIIDYFRTTTELNLNDLAMMLNESVLSGPDIGIVNINECEKTAGELLKCYHASSSSECIEFSNNIDKILLNWSEFQELLDVQHKSKRLHLKDAITTSFSENPEIDVEGLAKSMYDFVFNLVDPLFDFADCKKAALPLWKIHQGCLDEDFRFIQLLTKQINELIEGTDEPE